MLVVLATMLFIVALCTRNILLSLVLSFTIGALYTLLIKLNHFVCRKINRQREPFGINSSIRNVDYLLIGDYCDIKKYVPWDKSHVALFAPGRSYEGAFQILRNTHSILKEEGGTVVITIGKGKKPYTVFDVPFFHELTVKQYGLEKLRKKSRYPIIFAPINSLKFLMGGTRNSFKISENVSEELRAFCAERNYHLLLLKKI